MVALRVDGEFSEEFAGGGVQGADVEVLDEQGDVGSGVGLADADVAQPAGDAQGDGAGFADPVLADPVVGCGAAGAAGGGFRAGVVGRGGGGPVGQGSVGPAMVVLVDEGVDQSL
ncbi:hypothetical protein M1L60_13155 [Actinoplanes sp. TRM 88003]|uniref:Uncharacterized protein n=1 Tax=Paractinoplanes aksuensis TaxID=2939490 RepID=A0ABT1DP65_9ACTN|nr:hypothetical protein [Actinoplanes aksuensis]MCO8271541.1 hypothetical protein [Actinoplanes aksuensis]